MGATSTRSAAALGPLFRAINVLALVWWLTLSFDSYGSPLGLGGFRILIPAALSVLIPFAGAMAWRSKRRRHAESTASVRVDVLVSTLFLTLSWAAASAVTAGLLWMEEPWPLSLLQGPDTSRARSIFHQNFGIEPSVSNIYARVDWTGAMYLAFSFEDPAVVERLVERRSLRRLAPQERTVIAVKGPSWFPSAEGLRQIPETYTTDSTGGRISTLMWVDRVRRRVFILD